MEVYQSIKNYKNKPKINSCYHYNKIKLIKMKLYRSNFTEKLF